jgi:hypothetical protein
MKRKRKRKMKEKNYHISPSKKIGVDGNKCLGTLSSFPYREYLYSQHCYKKKEGDEKEIGETEKREKRKDKDTVFF